MKKIIVILISYYLIYFNSSCNTAHSKRSVNKKIIDTTAYLVYKIDSINNYYLIYARKGKTVFKIVSKKDTDQEKCTSILNKKYYNFHLQSVFTINGKYVIPLNSMYEVAGWGIDSSTTIKFEGDSIRDFYHADNIKGLCIIKN